MPARFGALPVATAAGAGPDINPTLGLPLRQHGGLSPEGHLRNQHPHEGHVGWHPVADLCGHVAHLVRWVDGDRKAGWVQSAALGHHSGIRWHRGHRSSPGDLPGDVYDEYLVPNDLADLDHEEDDQHHHRQDKCQLGGGLATR